MWGLTVPTGSVVDLAAARAALRAAGEGDPHTTTVLAAAALLEVVAMVLGADPRALAPAARGEVSPATGPGASVLDVGAGTGILAALARRAGARRAVGIEREVALVDEGRRRHPGVTLLVGDAIEGLPTGRFHIVVANLPAPTVERLVPALVAAASDALVVTGVRLVQGPPLRRALERSGLRDIRASAASGWCAYRALV